MKSKEELQKENDILRAENKQQKFLITNLQSQVQALNKHRFGSSSEKDPKQLPLFNEAEQIVDEIPTEEKETTNKKEILPIDDFFTISNKVKSALEQLILNEKVESVSNKIKQLGQKCKTILEKWAAGYSDKEIANIAALAFKSAATVKTTRHRCLAKLKAL